MFPLSVLVPTKNEELDLRGCLESVSWCDDIVVYDSYSSDGTLAVAEQSGARVVRRPGQDQSIAFGGDEAHHRTWGIREIEFNNPWLLVLDADERLSSDAASEIMDAIHEGGLRARLGVCVEPVAYQIRRRDFLFGRHLKYVQATPWYIRLFRPEFVHYERLVNPVTVVNGPIGKLDAWIDHYPFSKGFAHWIDKHNSYSSLEAKQAYLSYENFSLRLVFFAKDFSLRRRNQKQLFLRLPARPLVKFILLYFFKLGFLDGPAGFTYALLQSIYEYFIILKLLELAKANELSV
jgi:glycosyltransferase involved in cell wall biosynthesis